MCYYYSLIFWFFGIAPGYFKILLDVMDIEILNTMTRGDHLMLKIMMKKSKLDDRCFLSHALSTGCMELSPTDVEMYY